MLLKYFKFWGISILLFSCSSPQVYIPGNYENRPIFSNQKEMDIVLENSQQADYLSKEYPKESVVYQHVKVHVDFQFNEQYDSTKYYELDKNSKFKKLTERPVPDGQVFMNSRYDFNLIGIQDFVETPIVLHYNSMISIKNFNVTIDDNQAVLTKTDETNDGDEYFKTDNRYEYYDVSLPVRGSVVKYEYNEDCRDAKFNSVMYLPERYLTLKKTVKIALPDFLDYEIIEQNFGDIKFQKDTVLDFPKSGAKGSKIKYLQYTFYKLKPYKDYKSGRGPSHSYPMLYFYLKSAQKTVTPQTKKDETPTPIVKYHSLFKTTDDLYQWYQLVSVNLANDTSVFASFTKNLVKNIKSDEEKIKTIYYWIQDNIRYIAFEDGIAGFRPDECADVFKKRYGDCKGMANLTKNMLKVIGYDARMVYIGTKHQNFSYQKPGLPVDNHAICAVKLNGKFLFLDGTETYCALNEYANRIQGRQCIVENGNQYSIETIPEMDFMHNENYTYHEINIKDNKMETISKNIFKGESKLDFIRSYNLINSNNREKSLFNYLTNENVNYNVKNLKTSDLNNREIPTELNYQLTIKNNLIRNAQNQLYVKLDWEREFETYRDDSARTLDIDFGHKVFIHQKVVLNLNEGQTVVKKPESIIINNEFYQFELKMEVIGQQLIYTKKLITKKDYLPKELCRQFAKDCQKLHQFYNTYLLIN
jgi:hypothetical protein